VYGKQISEKSGNDEIRTDIKEERYGKEAI
jgi:hypothetical protein